MEFINMELNDIRPYVRFMITCVDMLHSDYVIPLEHRIVYINEGTAEFAVDDKTFTVEKNEMFLISAGVPYKMRSLGHTSTVWMYFDLTMDNKGKRERLKPPSRKDFADENGAFFCNRRLLYEDRPVRFLHIIEASSLIKQANRIGEYLDNGTGGKYQDDMVSGMTITLIASIFERMSSSGERNFAGNVATLALEYIHKNYSKRISLDDIAAAINFHKSYTNRCVKKETGLSVHKYLLNYRLEQAMQFLMYTDLSVSEVAETVGFTSPKGFAAAFKSYYDISPSGVKKLNL